MNEQDNRISKYEKLRHEFAHLVVKKWDFNATIADLNVKYASFTREQLHDQVDSETYIFYGRIMAWRSQGKSIFANIAQPDQNIQCYFKAEFLDNSGDFLGLDYFDINDVIGIKGTMMRTKKGELTVKVKAFCLLAKAYLPLFDKYHKLKDVEIRYRQRYIDFIANQNAYQTLLTRSKIIAAIRNFLTAQDFLEVETPLLHSILGGANALPFVTRHNTLKQNFYLRVAPELFLKRLVVAGFHKVFEIGRLFRNEGISKHHNPEFTSVEIYEAFSDMNGMMALVEKLLKSVVLAICNDLVIDYDGLKIDFNNFHKLTMVEALKQYAKIDFNLINTTSDALDVALQHKVKVEAHQKNKYAILALLYEELVESKIIDPTLIYRFPLVNSPLSAACEDDANFVDRFELIIAKKEYANAFSELTDPFEQQARFEQQVLEKAQGNQEANEVDHDYVQALKCGLVATGGIGIGIDRLVMLLTNQTNIREVIAFPTLRNVSKK